MAEKHSFNNLSFDDGMSKQNTGMPSLEELVAAIESEADQIQELPQTEQPNLPDDQNIFQYGQEQYIRFLLEDKLFAVPLNSALEIGQQPEITPLPNLPEWVVGISNIRGEIVSMVNLALFFRLSAGGSKNSRQFIIIHNGHLKTGILVNQIMGLLTVGQSREDMQRSPYRENEISRFTAGVIPFESTSLSILDTNRLLSSARMNQFN